MEHKLRLDMVMLRLEVQCIQQFSVHIVIECSLMEQLKDTSLYV